MKVKNWEELSKCKSSDKNIILEVYVLGGAWIRDKGSRKGLHYMSTHTFYDKNNVEREMRKLKEYGFDVELIPCEEE